MSAFVNNYIWQLLDDKEHLYLYNIVVVEQAKIYLFAANSYTLGCIFVFLNIVDN